jgi:hypothetical protein
MVDSPLKVILKSALMEATMLSVMKAGMIKMHKYLAISLPILPEHTVSFSIVAVHHCYVKILLLAEIPLKCNMEDVTLTI